PSARASDSSRTSVATDERVEQCARRVKGDIDAALRPVGRGPVLLAPRVLFGVHPAEPVALSLVLDPRVARGVEERATDDDDASGEEARARLEGRAADLERAVAADSAPPMDRERSAERGVIDLLVVTRRGLVDLAGALAHQRGVRRDVVVLREEGEQAHLYVVQASGRAEVIEASLAQRTPEAL